MSYGDFPTLFAECVRLSSLMDDRADVYDAVVSVVRRNKWVLANFTGMTSIYTLVYNDVVTPREVRRFMDEIVTGMVERFDVLAAIPLFVGKVSGGLATSLEDWATTRRFVDMVDASPDDAETLADEHRGRGAAASLPLLALAVGLVTELLPADPPAHSPQELQSMQHCLSALGVVFETLQYGISDPVAQRLMAQRVAPLDGVARQLAQALVADMATEGIDVAGVDANDVRFAAQCVAQVVSMGADFESAMALAVPVDLAMMSDRKRSDEAEVAAAQALFEAYLGTHRAAMPVVESVEAFITWVRAAIDQHLNFVFAPFIMLQDMITRLATELAKLITVVTGFLLDLMDTQFPEQKAIRDVAGVIMFGIADLVDVRHRQSPKSVWALLTHRTGARLSRPELFLTQLATFSHKPSTSYEAWADDMIRRLGRSGMDTSVLSVEPPRRVVRYPAQTFGPADNNDLELVVNTNFHETARELRAVARSLAAGAPRGIDSAWLGTAANVQSSIDRYVVPRPTISVEARQLIREAADAVFDDCRPLYDRPQPMSVASAMLAVEWKYSAGLPFLPAIRTRQELKSTGWYRAIAKAAEDILASGAFPDVAFHGFPKADVVPRDKILADGSAIRTVTAGDRCTAIAANALLGEVNKRIAPNEALVVNQLPRREGALQHVYEDLMRRDVLVTCDGYRFDSQVPKEVMSIGSTRLYERGMEGWWGARAATTFVEAYYSAVANGLVVNLMDGAVTRKTGGGGTGSAFTSSDNRNWVRIVFYASYAIAYGMPMSTFKDHVTFANAADDIMFSVDAFMRDGLQHWQEVIWAQFGLRFDFEVQATPEPLLHLRLVPEGMLDRDRYAELGIPVPTYSVMHDPARLALKRSDYRSDRMRHSYMLAADHVATRAFGHLLLTAHVPTMYHDVLEEGLEAATEFLAFFAKDNVVTSYLNENGQLVGADIRMGTEPAPAVLHAAGRAGLVPGTHEHKVYVDRRMKIGRRWLAEHRFPSYMEVFRLWVTPEDWDRVRPAQKKWTKLVSNIHVNVPAIDLVQAGLLRVADIVARVPIVLSKWSGPDIVGISRPLATQSFMVELFIYYKWMEKEGRRPSYAEFVAQVRASPYGAVTSVNEFWAHLSRENWTYQLAPGVPEDEVLVVFSARMWVFTLFYALIDMFNTIMKMNRLFGLALAIFFFVVRDLDKIYSYTHLGYWLAHGRASVAISNMSPRDPFIAQKMLALLLTALIPLQLLRGAGWLVDYGSAFVKWAVEVTYVGTRLRNSLASAVNRALQSPGDRWGPLIANLMAPATATRPRLDRIVAPMGSGKSTSLIASVLSSGLYDHVILVVPTVALVTNYRNDYVLADRTVLMEAPDASPVANTQLVVLTAAKALGWMPAPEWATRTMVLFDEAHLALTAQIVAWHRYRAMHCVAMTGTPLGVFWHALPGDVWVLTIEPQAIRTVIVHPGTTRPDPASPVSVRNWFDETLLYFRSDERLVGEKDSDARFAVYHPSVAACDSFRLMLERSGFRASRVSASSPAIPPSGCIVGTWAIVTGVNFAPPATAMVNLGLDMVPRPRWRDLDATHRTAAGNFADSAIALDLVPSSPSNCAQVNARVGRTQRGLVLQAPYAGTSAEHPHRPDALAHVMAVASGWDYSNPLVATNLMDQWLTRVTGFHFVILPARHLTRPTSIYDYIEFQGLGPNVRCGWSAFALVIATMMGSMSEALIAIVNDPAPDMASTYTMLLGMAKGYYYPLEMPPRPPLDLVTRVLSAGFTIPAGERRAFLGGRPLVAYKTVIAPCGVYNSTDAC